MHSALNRVQSVFGFFTSVAFVLGILASLSVVLHPAEPVSTVELANVQVYVYSSFNLIELSLLVGLPERFDSAVPAADLSTSEYPGSRDGLITTRRSGKNMPKSSST
jgi:hypothetical protein